MQRTFMTFFWSQRERARQLKAHRGPNRAHVDIRVDMKKGGPVRPAQVVPFINRGERI